MAQRPPHYEVRWTEAGEGRRVSAHSEAIAWAIYERRALEGKNPSVYLGEAEVLRNTPAENRRRLGQLRAREGQTSRMIPAGSVGDGGRKKRKRVLK